MLGPVSSTDFDAVKKHVEVTLSYLGCRGPASARTRATLHACRFGLGGICFLTLAPLIPLFLAFHLERACMQQRFLEQKSVSCAHVDGTKQAPTSLLPVVIVRLGQGRRGCWSAGLRSCATPPTLLCLSTRGSVRAAAPFWTAGSSGSMFNFTGA